MNVVLTQGFYAVIDDEDYTIVAPYKWHLFIDRNGYKYARATVDGKKVRMHRFILGNVPADKIVDHQNGNGLDNRRSNLRVCNRYQNMRNQHKTCGSSQYKGVSWRKRVGKWESRIWADDKKLFLGLFDSEIEAAKAYDKAAILHYHNFAKTNFMGGGD